MTGECPFMKVQDLFQAQCDRIFSAKPSNEAIASEVQPKMLRSQFLRKTIQSGDLCYAPRGCN